MYKRQLDEATLASLQDFVASIPVPGTVVEAIVDLTRATRPGEAEAPTQARELLRWGAGPRAGQQLVAACRARAALHGRPAVVTEDVAALAPAVLAHRVVPSFAAEARKLRARDIVTEILGTVTSLSTSPSGA